MLTHDSSLPVSATIWLEATDSWRRERTCRARGGGVNNMTLVWAQQGTRTCSAVIYWQHHEKRKQRWVAGGGVLGARRGGRWSCFERGAHLPRRGMRAAPAARCVRRAAPPAWPASPRQQGWTRGEGGGGREEGRTKMSSGAGRRKRPIDVWAPRYFTLRYDKIMV